MWCVAKLDEAYIERMEDVLKIYGEALTAVALVICLDVKSVVLYADTRRWPPIPRPPRPPRLRVQTVRDSERVLRRRTEGGTPLHQGNPDPRLS